MYIGILSFTKNESQININLREKNDSMTPLPVRLDKIIFSVLVEAFESIERLKFIFKGNFF